MDDPHKEARERIEASVLRGPGRSDAALRQAAAAGRDVPPELAGLVERIHRHAYRVTDEEMAALRGRFSEDELFEVVVAAALGAARHRLEAALQALEDTK